MAAKGARESITLACSDCKRRNYTTEKNKKNTTDRLEVVKYCPFCMKSFIHVRELRQRTLPVPVPSKPLYR